MTRKNTFLFGLLVVLGTVYLIFFSGLFQKHTIQIIPMVRRIGAMRLARDPGVPAVFPVSFKLDGHYQFTSIKVVEDQDFKTNKYPHAIWHLITEDGGKSAPTDAIAYGQPVRGMKPAIPNTQPESLAPNVRYVLLIEADHGDIRGQTNFYTLEAVTPSGG